MKRLFILTFVVCLLTVAAHAFPQKLGTGITLEKFTKVSEINAKPQNYLGKRVLIKGLVIDVCSSRGCWMDIASDMPFEKIQIKVVDGEIVFPMEAKGRTAKVEGIVEVLDLDMEETVEFLAHKAEEKGQKFDPKTVKDPLKIYRIRGLGAIIE
jgi:hypothetical protein